MSGGRLSGEELVLDLVGSIWDGGVGTEVWTDIVDRIGDAVGGPQGVFGIYDPPNGLVNMHAPRTDPDIMRSLVDWAPSNPSLPCIAAYPPGEVFNGADVISPDEFTRTAFYQGWWRPAGFSTEPLVTNLFADGAASGHFASHGLLNRSPFDSRQKRLFAVLAQHLVRTVALQRRLHHLTIANESTLTNLDGLEQGFLLVDSQARLLFVNRAARALLDSRDGLRLDAGALSTFNTNDGRTLRGLVASCAAVASAEIGSGGHIGLRRAAGRVPLRVLVTPIQLEKAMATHSLNLSQTAVPILAVSHPQPPNPARLESL